MRCLPYFYTWCGPIANLECRSEMCCARLAGNAGPKKSPSGHHRTTLSGCVFATKSHIDNWKKHVKQQYLLHISSQHGELSLVWGTPANFNGFHVLAALLHGTPVLGVSQTLRYWIEGTTYILQGGHHVGHWPTFLVVCLFRFCLLWVFF